MYFFHQSPNTCCTLVRYLYSSKGCPSPSTPKVGCIHFLELFWDRGVDKYHVFIGPPLGAWFVNKLSSTCSPHSSISLPRWNVCRLKDFATPTTMGASFLPLGCIFYQIMSILSSIDLNGLKCTILHSTTSNHSNHILFNLNNLQYSQWCTNALHNLKSSPFQLKWPSIFNNAQPTKINTYNLKICTYTSLLLQSPNLQPIS